MNYSINFLSAPVPLGTSGRVWSPWSVSWFSDVVMSCFLVLKGTHSPTVNLHRLARKPFFTPFLCLFLRPPF